MSIASVWAQSGLPWWLELSIPHWLEASLDGSWSRVWSLHLLERFWFTKCCDWFEYEFEQCTKGVVALALEVGNFNATHSGVDASCRSWGTWWKSVYNGQSHLPTNPLCSKLPYTSLSILPTVTSQAMKTKGDQVKGSSRGSWSPVMRTISNRQSCVVGSVCCQDLGHLPSGFRKESHTNMFHGGT